MKKLILIAIALFSMSLQAEVISDLKNCAKVADNSKRLECFDAVSGYYTNTALSNQAKENNAAELKKSPVTEQVADSDQIIISKEASFGKSMSEISEQDSIKTHIIGEFKGWKKGAILKLANNQTWKVISASKGYVNLNNPEVVISKGFWGSFDMKVEQMNAKAKVRRID